MRTILYIILTLVGLSVVATAFWKMQPPRLMPIPNHLEQDEFMHWSNIDIKNMSLKELIDSFGRPWKMAYRLLDMEPPTDFGYEHEYDANILKMQYGDVLLLKYTWPHLPASEDVSLIVWVVKDGDELKPVYGYAENEYWAHMP